jgi:hypothetical protein
MRRDDGNLMLLAGIIVTIAFILTALTLAQVSSLEREAAVERPSTISTEWRFLQDRIGANLNTSVPPLELNDTIANITFPAITATFRAAEAEKGYDVTMRLANATSAVNKTEASLVVAGSYDAWTVDGTLHFTQAADDKNDGILWKKPCPDETGSPNGCIAGLLVYLRVTDGISAMEEVLLYGVNRGP